VARVAGTAAAEAALMKALYDEHAAVLWRYALRLTGDASQAEDVVQETLLRAWQHPEVVGDSERSARAWLFTVARKMNAVNTSPLLTAKFIEARDRDISERNFAIRPHVDLTGRHVLLLDDTWTSGASARSAALTLRRAGAQRVSVMVIGRWLVPRYGRNDQFIRDRLQHPFDPRVCPVTGGDCP